MRAYRLKRPNGTWTKPIVEEADFDRSVRRRMHPLSGPVRYRENGGDASKLLDKGTGTERLLRRAHEADVGFHAGVLNPSGKGVLSRVVRTDPQPANTLGSPGVDLVVGFMNENFGGHWESWGVYNFKHIAGTNTYSDHAYVNHNVRPTWCGRAIDIRPVPFSVTLGNEIKAAILGEESIVANLRYLLWQVPDHYDHIHVSMDDPGAPGSC